MCGWQRESDMNCCWWIAGSLQATCGVRTKGCVETFACTAKIDLISWRRICMPALSYQGKLRGLVHDPSRAVGCSSLSKQGCAVVSLNKSGLCSV